ncbi:hypothetical protein [Mesobacillus maritimus]|uniref:hypothetical protein n=1 Tax=Mesobacillus maritimus TaxID=1643336 RepID=UPI00384AC9AF
MLKRCSFLVIAFVLMFTYFVPVTSNAAEHGRIKSEEVLTEEKTQQLVDTLDEYVYAQNNNLKIKNIPDSVYDEFGKKNVKAMTDGIKELNKSANDGELIITDNKTIYEADDTSYSVQGGIDKVVYKWYGRVRYFSTKSANDFVYSANKVAVGAAGVGVLASYFSAGTSALFGGLTSWYFANLALDIAQANSGHYRGIIMHVTWASVYWTERQ